MILYGQYDSPFVRRVAIVLTLYEMPFRQVPWSVFGDADRLRRKNPLTRVPALELADGECLIDSHMILDYLDSLVPEADRLFPSHGPARRSALQTAALACGIGDKAVSLFYERRLHEHPSGIFLARCASQIRAGWEALERHMTQKNSGPDHAQIAIACVWRFVQEAHPGLVQPSDFPLVVEHSEQMEALPAFRAIRQPFVAPT